MLLPGRPAAYGFREELYKKAREKGVIFMRYNLEDNLPDVKDVGQAS